jgi:hypothetical protein
LISQEAFNGFLQNIQRQIEELDKANKLKAENVLRAISENYRQKVSERLANELTLAEECRKIGNDLGARHHLALAEIYKSLFGVQTTT